MTDDTSSAPVSSGAEGRPPRWERDLLERLAFASLTEQRRARRWGIFFKLFFAAFESTSAQGIVLRANSPGGSPVQAGYINDEIKRLRAKYPRIPIYAVIGDVCASGCYYAVAAADKIYADKASVVGSIGVLMNGFGFVDTMKKVGVERRLMTA